MLGVEVAMPPIQLPKCSASQRPATGYQMIGPNGGETIPKSNQQKNQLNEWNIQFLITQSTIAIAVHCIYVAFASTFGLNGDWGEAVCWEMVMVNVIKTTHKTSQYVGKQ